MKKYPHIVNKDGVWYPAGTNVPEDAEFVLDNKVVGKVDGDVIEITDKEIIEETTKDTEDLPTYTKTDINRMPVSQLKKMAKTTGVEGADDMSGAELKEYLIAVLGL